MGHPPELHSADVGYPESCLKMSPKYTQQEGLHKKQLYDEAVLGSFLQIQQQNSFQNLQAYNQSVGQHILYRFQFLFQHEQPEKCRNKSVV